MAHDLCFRFVPQSSDLSKVTLSLVTWANILRFEEGCFNNGFLAHLMTLYILSAVILYFLSTEPNLHRNAFSYLWLSNKVEVFNSLFSIGEIL